MTEIVKRLIPRAWWVGVAVAVVVLVLTSRSAHSQAESRRGVVATGATTNSLGSDFLSPQDFSERFCGRLAEIMRERVLPAPQELVAQLTENENVSIVPKQAPGEKLSPEQIYITARKGVVVIGAVSPSEGEAEWSGSYATGFIVRGDGIVVTNAHVIEAFADTQAIAVMTDDGRVFPVQSVLAANRENDVAVLKVDADNLYALPIARDVAVGANVYCLSHPALDCEGTENAFYTFTQGIVSGKLRLRIESEEPVNALAITADYAQGSSGGPILNENGAVVGMVCHILSVCSGDSSTPQMTWKMARPAGSILSLLGDQPFVHSAATR